MSKHGLTWQELLDRFTRECPQEIYKKIHLCENVDEKVELCLQNEDVKKTVGDWVKERIQSNKFAKNVEKSTLLRQDGNKMFAGPNPEEALDIYTKSILTAPEGSSEMRLSYGNLSAVFFHLDKFKECIVAIDKSLTSDNEVRVLKLLIRKSKALLHLGKMKEASRIIDKAQNVCSAISEKNSKSDLSKFKAEIADCKNNIAIAMESDGNLTKPTDDSNNYEKPEILKNTEFPFASKSISLRKSHERGRYVVAKKKLKLGSVLFTEKPVAFVVLPQFRLYYCNHCCHAIKCPIPCSGCSGITYCSEACRDNAFSYHRYECNGGLSIAYSTGIAHLALRLALVKPLDPSGYARSASLLHHFNRMPPEDVYNYSLTGYALSLYLEEVGFCKSSDSYVSLSLDIGRLITNGHSIDDIRTADTPSGTRVAMESEDKIATAIYPSASMMNHSCRSNIANCFYGQFLLVKANQEIEEEGEIFNCYGVDCMRNTRKERREVLRSQYKFDCDCDACSAPIDPNERSTAVLCVKCTGPVVNTVCLDCSNFQLTSKEIIRQLTEADEKFSLAMDYFRRDWSKALEIFEEVLETRRTYLYELNKDVGLVYDRIVKCHSALGNYERAYHILKDQNIPAISKWYGSNSIELANVMNNCINVFCCTIMNKYSANSPDCDAKDSLMVIECIKMMEQVEVLFDLYYGQWSDKYKRLMRYKNFLVPLSQVWRYFLESKQALPNNKPQK